MAKTIAQARGWDSLKGFPAVESNLLVIDVKIPQTGRLNRINSEEPNHPILICPYGEVCIG
jgi:hypothetical protein